MKRLMGLVLIFIMLTSLLGSCSKTEESVDSEEPMTTETSSDQEEDKSEMDSTSGESVKILPQDDTETPSTLEVLTASFEDGSMSQEDYSLSLVSLAMSIEDSQEPLTVREGESYDLSDDAQWLVDHYDDLDPEGKALVDRMLGDYNPETGADNGRFMTYVHAAEDPENPYPREIMEGAYITHPLAEHGIELDVALETKITDMYRDVYDNTGDPLGIMRSQYKILITSYRMIGPFSSYSVLDTRQQELPDPEYQYTFVIHLDSEATDDTLKGSLIHELFHAYQYELGYTRKHNLEKFLMESTAIWAVTFVDENLAYPGHFDDPLYNGNVDFDVTGMTDAQMKSWYQFHWMIENEIMPFDYTKKLLENGLGQDDLMPLLRDTLEDDQMHQVMADFGLRLVCDMGNSGFEMPPEAPYAGSSMEDEVYDSVPIEDLMIRPDETSMSTMPFTKRGYLFYKTDLADRANAIIDVMNSIEGDAAYDETGMFVLYQEDDEWKVMLAGERDDYSGNLDTKDRDIGGFIFGFFSFNSSYSADHKYMITLQERISGEGSIEVLVKTDYDTSDMDNPKTGDSATYSMSITEDIELYKVEGSTDEDMMMDLLMGDTYYVKDFQAFHNGHRKITYLDDTYEKYDYSGTFHFNESQAAAGDYPNDMISGTFSQIFNDMGSMLDGFMDMPGLSDMEGMEGMPDLSGLMGELGEAQNEAQEELDSLGSSMEMFFPNPNKLIRMKEIPQNESFQLYPTLPVGFVDSDWVTVNSDRTYYDEYDQLQHDMKRDTTLPVFEVFPIWFRNAEYDPTAAEDLAASLPQDPMSFAAEFDEMSDITDQILFINGAMDPSNLYNCFDTGEEMFDLNEMDSAKKGTMTQELIFTESGFVAHLTGVYEAYDADHYVDISMQYDFR